MTAATLETRVPTQTFDIKAESLSLQLEKVEKANRRAARASIPMAYTWETEPYTYTWKNEAGTTLSETRIKVMVFGEVPRKDGWEFIGTVDWDEEIGATLHLVPGVEGVRAPESKVCDHCQSIRSRKNTYLVRHEDGVVRQVGTQCLTAYTGIPVGWVLELDKGVDEVEPGFGVPSEATRVNLVDLLTFGARYIREYGYVKYSEEDGPGTSHYVRMLAFFPLKDEKKVVKELMESLTEKDCQEAQKAIEWARSIDEENAPSTYHYNMARIFSGESVSFSNAGLAVSALVAYKRDEEKKAEMAKKEPVPVGNRIAIEGEVISLKCQEDYYSGGATLKMVVQGEGGWRVWCTVPVAIEDDIQEGVSVSFVANVEVSDDDKTFGFAKRPRQAKVL